MVKNQDNGLFYIDQQEDNLATDFGRSGLPSLGLKFVSDNVKVSVTRPILSSIVVIANACYSMSAVGARRRNSHRSRYFQSLRIILAASFSSRVLISIGIRCPYVC